MSSNDSSRPIDPIKSLVEENVIRLYPRNDYEVYDVWRGYDVLDTSGQSASSVGYACARIWKEFRENKDWTKFRIENVTLSEPLDGVVHLKHNKKSICWIKLLPQGELGRRQKFEAEQKKIIEIQEKRKKAKLSLLWASLWITGALWLQFMTGHWNPFNRLNLIWKGQYTDAELIDISEEWVDGGDEGGGGGYEKIHKYQYTVNGRNFTTTESRLDLKERESVKYLPEDPSASVIEGADWHSSTQKVIRHILFRLAMLIIPLYVAYVFASSGIRDLRKYSS